MDKKEKDLKGIGGWLILVAIGVTITPAKIMLGFIPIYIPIFKDGTWEAFTTPGTECFHPLWAPLLIGELAYNSIMTILSILMIYLFYTKNYMFPKFFIVFMLVSMIAMPIDGWLVSIVLPNNPILSPEATQEFTRLLLGGAIWIPYMLVSKRVRATFIEKSAKNINFNGTEADVVNTDS